MLQPQFANKQRFYKLQSVSNHIGCQKSKEPTPAFYICVLSALRLCVWLFDNFYFEVIYAYQTFFFTFWTIQRKVF